MTQLLVSVRNAEEAREALAGGADWIDAKEPARGSLGLAAPRQLAGIRRAVGGRAPLTAACGELLDGIPPDRLRSLTGYRLLKAGLARCVRSADWSRRWAEFAAQLPPGAALVAVAYADHGRAGSPPPADVVRVAGRLGCAWLLIDTFDKSRGHVFEHLADDELARLISMARRDGLRVALAGSLSLELLPRVVAIEPDIVAVRSAACRGGRTGRVAAECVRRIARQLSTPLSPPAAPAPVPLD
jgi:uncharacterized protein (UPF0264 family)